MHAIELDTQWAYRHLNADEPWTPVYIPHDAMLSEPRYEQAISGINSGWFDGRDYEYTRDIRVEEKDDLIAFLEFEGVYQHARVDVDGQEVAYRPYGYTNFSIDVSHILSDGQTHTVHVIARNADQPNSRWYSGAGIYRPVHLWTAQTNAIMIDGVYAVTDHLDGVSTSGREARQAEVTLTAETYRAGQVEFALIDAQGKTVAQTRAHSESDGGEYTACARISVPDAQLWSPDHPYLYTVRARILDEQGTDVDRSSIEFGVRTLQWGEKGFLLNGTRVIIQGACVHHDNGVLGAAAYEDAEMRKVALMQRAGYNALRSAHNPCSRAMLRACDRLGMLMMDEYIDHWYIHKTQYDYVDYFEQWWRQDVTDMVRKDRSHASVIMYSTGNEVSETAQPRGIELTGQLTDFIHALDATRPVTCGINIFFNFLSSVGLGVYSDEKARAEVDENGRSAQAAGSQFFNDMAGRLGADFMKTGATLPMCDWRTKDAFAAMDVAGYNYGIKRYEHDLKKYPQRLILGSETFCSDAYAFRELAKKHPRLIGDFVWAGMDYLGEVGVGAWEYEDYAPRFSGFGWLTAGSGRVDLIGQQLGEALYTRVALEKETGPFLAVQPVNHTKDKHSPSAWKMSNALESWSWQGCEGQKAVVEVYARAFSVELRVNGRRIGRKKLKKNCMARFTCVYEAGRVEAIAYDEQGRETGRSELTSAGAETQIRAVLDSVNGELLGDVSYEGARMREAELSGGHLAFVRLQYTDECGHVKPLMRGRIHLDVQGGELLGLGSAAPFNLDSFVSYETGTYYGQALAVIRAHEGADAVCVRVSDGTYEAELSIPVSIPEHIPARG